MLSEEPLEPRNCSIADALEILGERWTFLAIREMVYGAHRFERIVGFTGISRDILSDRLRKLEAHGVVEKRQYSEHPPRFEYYLTEAGDELVPVLMALAKWGHRWAGDDNPGRAFRHDCGHPLDIDHVCHACGNPVTAENVEPFPAATA
jgi:DNA-binding HxlR family transcriptional regulator